MLWNIIGITISHRDKTCNIYLLYIITSENLVYFYYINISPVKIVYFTDTFHPMINGIVTSIIAYSKELADRGHEVLIIVPDNP